MRAAAGPDDPPDARPIVPLVSIVIPCYRQGHFLADAIESALAQTYAAVEVVVVNDGSPDDTADVAARYPSIRYVEQDNAGLAAARNTGLATSRGDFVVFLDADDRLLPDAVRINAGRLAVNPALGFVAGGSYYVARDGTPLPTDQRPQPVGDLYAVLLERNRIRMPASVMFRRSVLQAIGGFDSKVDACADYDMYLRVSRDFAVAFHDTPVAEYRRHGANMSLNAALMLRHLRRVMRQQRRHIRGHAGRRAALRAGRRNIREYYGDHLANVIRERVRARAAWRRLIADAVTLLVYDPRAIVAHGFRKAMISARRIRPAGTADVVIGLRSSGLLGDPSPR